MICELNSPFSAQGFENSDVVVTSDENRIFISNQNVHICQEDFCGVVRGLQ